MKPTLHLLCNAHLDPVWLWEWEEGAAEAISTFRTAADLCEEFDGFIFNHNEAVLYEWVEEYEPALFKRIQDLVRKGKWHIMGGWYLQPDCNLPSGESFTRQILVGKRYFKEKFGVEPRTAINFDSFGHTRGLVQILAKSGYDSYIHMRPNDYPVKHDYRWIGFDGSSVICNKVFGAYLTPRGKAVEKCLSFIKAEPERDTGLILWGIGDHGGGPSREDLTIITERMKKNDGAQIIHSTPEAYFKERAASNMPLPEIKESILPFAVGCYTSQVRIKQKHRLLENELYMLEKMCAAAFVQGLIAYPADELQAALKDLLFCEFHDILPGSSIQPVEDMAIRKMDHALEIASRLKARAFFALAAGQPKAKDGEIPVLVYNPHPYPVDGVFACEFQLADQNWSGTWTDVNVYADGKKIPTQVEQEMSNLNFLDWRKHVVFRATLAPSSMNRFDCRLITMKKRPARKLKARNGKITFKTDDLTVVINTKTGLIDTFRAKGKTLAGANAFQPVVLKDNDDSWGMQVKRFDAVEGVFKLMNKKDGTRFSGVTEGLIDSVRVVEDGEVRAVVEAVFAYGSSAICQRYKLPRHGTSVEIETRVHWEEKSRMLKLRIPVTAKNCVYRGQTAFGAQDLPVNGDEAVAQQWMSVIDAKHDTALTVINDGTYASDFSGDGLRITLLRSPGYSGHPHKEAIIMRQDRYSPRIDQGERLFRFWIAIGRADERARAIDREALSKNQKPYALSFFPSGSGTPLENFVTLSDDAVIMSACKKAEDSDALIIRLFEPTGTERTTTLAIPSAGITHTLTLKPFEVKTVSIDRTTKLIKETDLLER
ncbi:MAG: alpha-mannosidase [Spirochaetes bacterium]|nr:alpha-mannosidase [Spirochaetota bacterium]